MKAYELQSNTGIDALTLSDRPQPQPGWEQRENVRSGLNYQLHR